MAKKPRNTSRRSPSKPTPASRRSNLALSKGSVTREWKVELSDDARERLDDLAEVEQIIAAGELEIAVDELRWLLEDCSDFLPAHRLLGMLALEAEDWQLARAHFGVVFDLCCTLMPTGGLEGTLPYHLVENQVVHECGRGLAWSLHQLGNQPLALQVIAQMLRWDPSDPVKVANWQRDWSAEKSS